MGAILSNLLSCKTSDDVSGFARKNIKTFVWKAEYRCVGVLDAVVTKAHLATDSTSVEFVGNFLADFAADAHGANIAATPAVYDLLVKRCLEQKQLPAANANELPNFEYETTSPIISPALGRAMTNIAENCDSGGKNIFSTEDTVTVIGIALGQHAAAAPCFEKLISIIASCTFRGEKLVCTDALVSSVIDALEKYSDTTDSCTSLCNVINSLSNHERGQALFSSQDCAKKIARLITNAADSHRSLELMRVVASITKANSVGQQVFFSSTMGLAMVEAFDVATADSVVAATLCGVIASLCGEDNFCRTCNNTLCCGKKPYEGLFFNQECADAITNLIQKHAADPERILRIMRVTAALSKDGNAEGPRGVLFDRAMGGTIASAFRHATTAVHLEHLTNAVLEVAFIKEDAAGATFFTNLTSNRDGLESVVSVFARVLKSVSARAESRKYSSAVSLADAAPISIASVTVPAQKLLDGNPVCIKAFADVQDFADELKRIDDFSIESSPEAIHSLRQLRLLLLTREWGGPFVTSCFTDPALYCGYCWCPTCGAGRPHIEYPYMDQIQCAMSLANCMTLFLAPPVTYLCMSCESVLYRRTITRKYDIVEPDWKICCACLFPCNAMVQHNYEMERRGRGDGVTSRQINPKEPMKMH